MSFRYSYKYSRRHEERMRAMPYRVRDRVEFSERRYPKVSQRERAWRYEPRRQLDERCVPRQFSNLATGSRQPQRRLGQPSVRTTAETQIHLPLWPSPTTKDIKTRSMETELVAIDNDRRQEGIFCFKRATIGGRGRLQEDHRLALPSVDIRKRFSVPTTISSSITSIQKTAEEILGRIWSEADERATQGRAPLEVDVWVHVGMFVVRKTDYASYRTGGSLFAPETTSVFSSADALSMLQRGRFKGGLTDFDVDSLHRSLAGAARFVQACVRYDITIYTPTGRERRFKVWVQEKGTRASGVRNVEGLTTGNEGIIGSELIKAGPGILSTSMNPLLKADIALPGCSFDCRLLIRTGVHDATDRTEREREEDDILIREFCSKVRVKGKHLNKPPLPPGYHVDFERRSERTSYLLKDFEVTTSRETYSKRTRGNSESKIDIHLHSKACERLMNAEGGRLWKPRDVAASIPGLLQFLRDDVDVFD